MPERNYYYHKPQPQEPVVEHHWEERRSWRREKREKVMESRYAPQNRTVGGGIVMTDGWREYKRHVGWDWTEYLEVEWYCKAHMHYKNTEQVIRKWRTGL